MPQNHRTVAPRRPPFRRSSARRWPVAVALGWGCLFALSAGMSSEAQAARRRRKVAARVERAEEGERDPMSTPTRSSSGPGHVLFVTDRRAYLDRGRRDGLASKQTVSIQRAGRPVASCTIEAAAERSAVCVGARLRNGDTFVLPARAAPAKTTSVVTLPPVTAASTLRQRADEVAEAPQEKVDLKGVHLFGGRARVQVGAVTAFWRTQSDPRFDYAVEQLDGAVRGYQVGDTGLKIDAAFSAMRWSGSGSAASASRFRPEAQTQFYLWQAELSRRQDDGGTVFAGGRIWPWHLPGLTLLDGFQLGRRDRAGTREAGIYAGFLPNATTVSPATDTWGAGAYGMLTQTGTGGGTFRLARETARLGVWQAPGGGLVTEGDGAAQVWLGPTMLAGGGRLRAAGSGTALERLFLDFAVRSTAAVGGGFHLRYFGASPGPLADLQRVSVATEGSVHATGDLHVQPWPWLGFAGFGGLHRERESGLGQKHGGVEVRMPRVLGSYAGLSLGAEAQEGWLRMRTLYADVVMRPARGVVAWARVSALASQIPSPVATSELHELGGQVHVDAVLASWLRLQTFCAAKNPWLIRGEPPPVASAGLTAGLGAQGVF